MKRVVHPPRTLLAIVLAGVVSASACGDDGGAAETEGTDGSSTDGGLSPTTVAPPSDDTGSDGPPGGGVCDPGEQLSCQCSDGGVGTQRCDVFGNGYDPCLCTGGDTDGPPAVECEGNRLITQPGAGSDGALSLVGCTHITGSLTIDGAWMQDLDDLESLRVIDGTLRIVRAAELDDLQGLENLALVGGDVQLVALTAVRDISQLAEAQIVGDLVVDDLPLLEDLAGVGELQFLGGGLFVRGTGIVDATGLEGLDTVTGPLEIADNPMLASLVGLSESLVLAGGTLVIRDNSLLPGCEAEALACAQVQAGFVGALELQDNADVCNDCGACVCFGLPDAPTSGGDTGGTTGGM